MASLAHQEPKRLSRRISAPAVSGAAASAFGTPHTPVSYTTMQPVPCPSYVQARDSLLPGTSFLGVYWETQTKADGAQELVGPYTHAARVTSVGWDEQKRESYMHACWVGGADNQKRITTSSEDDSPTPYLPLSFIHDISAYHSLPIAAFDGGLFGYTLSAGFKLNDYPLYSTHAYMKSLPKELMGVGDFGRPSSVLEFCPIAIRLANVNAISDDPDSPDDGLSPLTERGLFDELAHRLFMGQILRPDGSLNTEMVKVLGLRKPVVHPNVETFILTEDDIKGRDGLAPGEKALRVTKFTPRGSLLFLYTGHISNPDEHEEAGWGSRLMSMTLVPRSATRKVIIDPVASPFTAADGNVGQFANDPSIDLANKRGKRMQGAGQQNAFICPFRFLHFPMTAVFAERDIPPWTEIMVDYGAEYRLP
jgi:hypothetical protein